MRPARARDALVRGCEESLFGVHGTRHFVLGDEPSPVVPGIRAVVGNAAVRSGAADRHEPRRPPADIPARVRPDDVLPGREEPIERSLDTVGVPGLHHVRRRKPQVPGIQRDPLEGEILRHEGTVRRPADDESFRAGSANRDRLLAQGDFLPLRAALRPAVDDRLPVEVLHVGIEVREPPRDALVPSQSHAGQAGQRDPLDEVPADDEPHGQPDSRRADSEVRIVRQDRLAALREGARNDPAVRSRRLIGITRRPEAESRGGRGVARTRKRRQHGLPGIGNEHEIVSREAGREEAPHGGRPRKKALRGDLLPPRGGELLAHHEEDAERVGGSESPRRQAEKGELEPPSSLVRVEKRVDAIGQGGHVRAFVGRK